MTEGIFALDAGSPRRPPKGVVLAGGRGTRLAPYTSILPKPLMPVGDRSILEVVMQQLADCGIVDVTLCVGYLSHLIEAVLDNGATRGMQIRYVREEAALGTAAPLRLVPDLDDTFIAMNGDVLTTLDFNDLIRHHRAAGNLLTIATRVRSIKIDYGVLRVGTNGSTGLVQAYEEKPELTATVSMGVYALEPGALDFIPPTGHFDVPDLVQALLAAELPVGAYAHDGLWFDIGRPSDYEQAVDAWLAAIDPEESALEIESAVQA